MLNRKAIDVGVNTHRTRNRLGYLVACALLGVTIFWLSEEPNRARSFENRVRGLKIGDNQKEVLRVLGKPNTMLSRALSQRLITSNEVWIYGDALDIRNAIKNEPPYFLPIRVRLLGPDEDDYAFVFDTNGILSQIIYPQAHANN